MSHTNKQSQKKLKRELDLNELFDPDNQKRILHSQN